MINVKYFLRNIMLPGAFRIPKAVTVNGNIDASISGRIDGNVRGDIKSTGKLIISEQASIRGHIYATDLVVYGKVYGDVYISHKAHLSTKAYIKGDVNAMILDIEEGAVVEGAIRKNVQSSALTADATVEETREPFATDKTVDREQEPTTNWF